jgi:hypothetical protein
MLIETRNKSVAGCVGAEKRMDVLLPGGMIESEAGDKCEGDVWMECRGVEEA